MAYESLAEGQRPGAHASVAARRPRQRRGQAPTPAATPRKPTPETSAG